MTDLSLVTRLRANAREFQISKEENMRVWDVIREDIESGDYNGASHPRDVFESLVCTIEEHYHALLREAATALDNGPKQEIGE